MFFVLCSFFVSVCSGLSILLSDSGLVLTRDSNSIMPPGILYKQKIFAQAWPILLQLYQQEKQKFKQGQTQTQKQTLFKKNINEQQMS